MSILSQIATSAIELAKLGWLVVPLHGLQNGRCTCSRGEKCRTPGKHPRLSGWQDKATTDEATITEWFTQWPHSNLGVRLGPTSGIVDIEFDNEEGRATAEELFDGIETPTYQSSRSIHRLFQFPSTLPAKAVKKLNGLELRFGTEAKGTQSVFPPSTHHTGKKYEWLDGLSPWDVPLAPLPPALLNQLGSPEVATHPVCGNGFTMSHAMPFDEHPGASEGERRDVLCTLVGTHLSMFGADGSLVPKALDWASRCEPAFDAEEVLSVVADLASRRGRNLPNPLTRLLSRRFAEIAPESVEWLWPGRIALGKLSLLVGDPGLGKTFLACDLAARVSAGRMLPDKSQPASGEVAILTAEDGAGDTLRPRLDAHGADVSRVHHFDGVKNGEKEEFLSLQAHLTELGQWFKSHPQCRLLIIDPISAYLGSCDSHNNSEVRAILTPVAKLAEAHNVAIVGITHLSKAQNSAVKGVIGSIAFVAAARCAWRVGADPDNPERRLFLPVKNNLANSKGLAFRIVDDRIDWEEGEVLISADELDSHDDTPRDEAERWLLAQLEDGPRPANKLLSDAKANGISDRTLKRAKKALHVDSKRDGRNWVWTLPGQAEMEPPAVDPDLIDEGIFD